MKRFCLLFPALFLSIILLAQTKLSGTGIGSTGSWNNMGDVFSKALDGNLNTSFDAAFADGQWVGLDIGTGKIIKSVKYAPTPGWANRMVGGKVQGANSADFIGAVDLLTISASPATGVLTSASFTNTTSYRYVRYLSPNGGWCNIAEIEFWGIDVPAGVSVTGITVSPTSTSVVEGNTVQLIPTISPANASNQTVSYSTNNATIATVSASGLVTTLLPGSVVITATTQDGNFTATSTITVTAQPGGITFTSLQEPGSGGWLTSIAISPFDSNRVLLAGDMLGIGYSTNNGVSWKPSTGLTGFEIADFTFHPTSGNIVWVGTMSGPFKSIDSGKTWTGKRTGMDALSSNGYSCPIQKIIFDPTDNNHLLAFGGSHREWSSNGSPKWNAVWNSTDGGENWAFVTTIASASAPGIMSAAYIGVGKIILASNGNGVYISNNNGASWSASNTGLPHQNVFWLEINQSNKNIIYAGLGPTASLAGSIYKSINGGASWSSSSTGLPVYANGNSNFASCYKQISISASNPNILYTSNKTYTQSGIFKSIDAGANWTSVASSNLTSTIPIFFGAPGPSMTVITASPTNSNVCWAAGSEYVLKTTDGGATWKDMLSATTGNGLFTGNGFNGLVTSGIQFNPYNSGECALMSLDDGKFMFSRNNLTSWKKNGNGMSNWNGGNDACFAGVNGATIYLTTGQYNNFDGVGVSNDNGVNWNFKDYTSFAGTSQYGAGQPLGIYALPATPATAWVVVQNKLFKTVNGGSSWSQVFTAPGLQYIAAKKNTPTTFYVNGDNGIYQTTDGTNFTLMPGSPLSSNRIHIDPNDDTKLFCTVYKTNNSTWMGAWKYNGSNWIRIYNHNNVSDIAIRPGDGNYLVISFSENPYKDYTALNLMLASADGGATWFNNINGLPMTRVNVVAFNPFNNTELLVGLNGRGFYRGTISSVLPVRIESFTATMEGNTVNLVWLTGEELNVARYEIELSADGISFKTIGNIQAENKRKYTLRNNVPLAGIQYYRLKTIDKDGKIAYSEIRKISFGKKGKINIYPNPVTGNSVNISVEEEVVNERATISILGAEGRLVSKQSIYFTGPSKVLNIGKLSQGMYIFSVQTKNGNTNIPVTIRW